MSKTDPCGDYWYKVFANAQVWVSGASDAQTKVCLFDTLMEFFDESNCWREDISFVVVPDTCDYPLTTRTGQIRRLWSVIDQNATPQAAFMSEIGTVRMQYPYSIVQPMCATIVKVVKDPLACCPPDIPDWVLPNYHLVIQHGLIGNLMNIPGESYSNPEQSMFHMRKFKDGIAHARVAMMKANTVGAQAWMFPQQFRVFGQRGGVSTYNVFPTAR